MATSQLEMRYHHRDWEVGLELAEEEAAFFTEDMYEMFSLSRIRNIVPHTQEKCQLLNETKER